MAGGPVTVLFAGGNEAAGEAPSISPRGGRSETFRER